VIVLDAAALVDLVLDQPSSEWILTELAGQSVLAPAHQPAEVLSALARLRRAGIIDGDTLDATLAEAMDLGQEFVPPSLAAMRRATQLAPRLRMLDGLYVALAEERACPLVTTDRRLAGAGVPCEVQVPPQPSAPGSGP
jgi:predicted nucleic acid-binding protein